MRLTPQWIDWFDRPAADSGLVGEFSSVVDPKSLLEESPEPIWPGLMPPDLLPLIGNSMGDWLCGRVGADDTIVEVVHWYHGGGDCLPYGDTIAEAILYDALASRFPGKARRLAVPATDQLEPTTDSLRTTPSLRWATDHLPPQAGEVLRADFPVADTAHHLLGLGIAVVPLCCDLTLAALDNELLRRMTPQTAALLEARWEHDVVRWMFDTRNLPPEIAQRLAVLWALPAADWRTQDWETARVHCRQVADRRDDLAWAHDILGWAAERDGDLTTAISHYRHGALTSVFSDQAVRFRTHFESDRVCKFSVARLVQLNAADQLDAEYVSHLRMAQGAMESESPGWRDRVSDYWLRHARSADAASATTDRSSPKASTELAAAQRYQTLYRAGWDVGCDSIRRYCQLLGELAEAAEAARQLGRASLARTHQACLRARYLFG